MLGVVVSGVDAPKVSAPFAVLCCLPVGLFDVFRRRKPIDPGLRRAAEDYRRELAEGAEEAARSVDAILGGLSERDVSLLLAAAAALIQAPPHLAGRLDLYLAREEHLRRREAETEAYTYFGLAGADTLDAALDLLLRQEWWPDFAAGIRERFGITTAADIGRWGRHGKRAAPYVWDCGYLFQTPEAVERDGPVSVWSWRVDLRQGTAEPI